MHDRPDAAELLAAVREFLQQEIVPTLTDQRQKFRALIAANVLGVVERELAAGDVPLREEWRRLCTLLHLNEAPPEALHELRTAVEAGTAELCRRIRAGEADAGTWHDEVYAFTRWTVEQKLRVSNPRYLSNFVLPE